jgi:hypothetical protein
MRVIANIRTRAFKNGAPLALLDKRTTQEWRALALAPQGLSNPCTAL